MIMWGSTPPMSLHSRPTRMLNTSTGSIEWASIDRWLQSKYRTDDIPVFERTEETYRALLELMQLNEAQDTPARQALHSLRQLSNSYKSEDTKLKETLQILDIQKDHLPQETQHTLFQLSELAMDLGASDTQLSTLHQGLAQLHVETAYWQTLQHQDHISLLNSLDRHQAVASQDLIQIQELKRQFADHRSTVGDIEFRTQRRSAELMRIKAREDKSQLEGLCANQQLNGLDVKAQGLTVAQLDQQEQEVTELERQIDVQTKSLTSYQAIPPDLTLARLKVKEAMMRLEGLRAEHEILVQELADDL